MSAAQGGAAGPRWISSGKTRIAGPRCGIADHIGKSFGTL
jgi:hypothetical protein